MKKTVNAIYGGESKNYHKFLIDHNKRIVGRIYFLKGEEIPDILKTYIKTDGEIEREKKEELGNRPIGKRRGLKTDV